MHLPYSSRREAMRYLLSAASLLCANDTTQAKEAIHQVPHPRLIANAALWEQLSVQRSQAPQPEAFIQLQLDRARKDLGLGPVERKLEGRRLLGVSREFILRTLLWAFAYRVSGERVFMDRAAQEMLAVAAFLGWHPAHFLDVAEMTTGMAIGYHWLFHELTPADRSTLRRAIVDKGIGQARHGHKTFAMTHNWGQVCIGGMVLGDLAVQEDEPELLQDLHKAARAHAFTALGTYQPFAAFGSRCEQVIPIRLEDGIRDRLDQLAHATHRSKSFLAAQAQEVFVENSDWQVAEIQSALRDADVADYASDQDVANLTFKWQVRAP